MQAGNYYYFECKATFANVSASNLTECKHRVFMTVDGNTYEAKSLTASDGVAAGFADGTYDIQTPQFPVPAGSMSSIFWQVQAKFSAASATPLVFSVGRIKMIEVAQL